MIIITCCKSLYILYERVRYMKPITEDEYTKRFRNMHSPKINDDNATTHSWISAQIVISYTSLLTSLPMIHIMTMIMIIIAQIVISYTSLLTSLPRRQDKLACLWFFTCSCQRYFQRSSQNIFQRIFSHTSLDISGVWTQPSWEVIWAALPVLPVPREGFFFLDIFKLRKRGRSRD